MTVTAEREKALLESVPTGLLIDGEWRDASSGKTFDVKDPATGKVIASLQDANSDDAMAAFDAACAAQADWARTPAKERADILRRAYDLINERAEDFALLMTLEMGKPLAEARGEVTYGNGFLRWFSEEAGRHYGRTLTVPEGTLRMQVHHRPVGPCLLITPWNFPLAMATRKVGPAVAAGCTMVLKAAKLTPLTTQLFAQVMQEAGLPKGVLNVVAGSSASSISSPILQDRRLRKVSFTGSTPVGVRLMKDAADNVLRTSMELGGNAPFIVFEDADIDQAVAGAMGAKMRNIGEACTAANRFLVHESVAEEFTQKLAAEFNKLVVGNGLDEGVTCGPLIEAKALDNIAALVDDAVEKGATVVTGGKRGEGEGHFYAPTILSNVSRETRVAQEEIFGPVAPIFTFSEEAEALELANETEYGLASYVFTENSDRLWRVADGLEFGLMGFNAGVISNAAAPFGGVKQSGMGREGSRHGLEDYLEMKYLCMGGI